MIYNEAHHFSRPIARGLRCNNDIPRATSAIENKITSIDELDITQAAGEVSTSASRILSDSFGSPNGRAV
jgi:hypothetical protein